MKILLIWLSHLITDFNIYVLLLRYNVFMLKVIQSVNSQLYAKNLVQRNHSNAISQIMLNAHQHYQRKSLCFFFYFSASLERELMQPRAGKPQDPQEPSRCYPLAVPSHTEHTAVSVFCPSVPPIMDKNFRTLHVKFPVFLGLAEPTLFIISKHQLFKLTN